ncbi:MAG: flagellar hook-associated protein FlgK [Opitutales bacterium]|nr:flagellar hook-associated protein FlgK [Opitutales bacterium]NRA28168.1 flagellar hook-associated protein FlgK [Opitutales bacterium]
MSLIGNIYNQTRALSVHRGSIEAAGKNIANVNNPEYARQRMQVVDRGNIVIGDQVQSMGIETGKFDSFRDALIDGQIVRETSQTEYAKATDDMNRQLVGYWGEDINRASDAGSLDGITDLDSSTLGLNERLDSFFNSMSELAANPSEVALRAVTLQEAESLTVQLNDVASNLSAFATDIDQRLDNELAVANDIIDQIAALNVEIASIEMRSGDLTAVDLRDARQQQVEKLSEIMDIETAVIADSFGQISVSVDNGVGAPVTVLERGVVNGEFSFNGTNIVFGTGATVMGPSSGRAQAYLDFRDGGLADLQTDLNNLASQLVTSVNGAYPTDFFDPAGTTAATISLDAALTPSTLATSATANAGANDVVQAIYALRNTTFSTGGGDAIDGTFGDFVVNVTGRVAQAAAVAEQNSENQDYIQTMLGNERAKVGGVDLDEEAADLLRFQRAYQATSRVISIMDELLEELVRSF